MATDAEDPGFLSRWSRRKTLQRQGVALLDPAAPVAPTSPAASVVEASVPAVTAAALVTDRPSVGTRSAVEPGPAGPTAEAPAAPAAPAAPREPAPTLADVAELTRESDFTPFLRPGVQPEVKNAALAKLFTDPHFNVMDGLDIYIDDYGKPDPLPPGMLRMMVQAHTLGLFDDEEDEEDDKKIDEKPDEKQAPQLLNPAPADASAPPLPPEPATDEDTDLQLQPDDGAGRPGPEAGAGQDARLPH